jgi:proteasome assembly chaperone (PAC2) family protein
MSGRFSSGPRARAIATDSANALAVAVGRLPNQAASICLTRSVSASRRSRSNLECLANGPSFRCTDVWVRRGSVPEVRPETTRWHVAYPSRVSLYTLDDPRDLIAPVLIAAFDGWVDAGSAATTALAVLADDGTPVATFDGDQLFDYRARRPPLEIVDGRLTELTWPSLVLRRTRLEERDLLILLGPEPDYRWRQFTSDMIDLASRLGVVQWISLGAIPAAVPHTRQVPIMGTEASPGLLRGDVTAGPAGTLRVPSALVSALEIEVAAAGIPALGYFAQVPHYVSGPYATAALELLRALGNHLGATIPARELEQEARELRTRLDTAAGLDESTRGYVERLEAMYDEQRLPSGDDLISDIERFLRDQGGNTPPGGLVN